MKFIETEVKIATQVINMGQPEKWHVIKTKVQHEENDTIESVIDAAFEKLNAGHDKHSQSFIEVQPVPPMYKRQTFEDLKRELHAPGK